MATPPPRDVPARQRIAARAASASLSLEPHSCPPVAATAAGANSTIPPHIHTTRFRLPPPSSEPVSSPGSSLLDQVCTFLIQMSRAKGFDIGSHTCPSHVTVCREFRHVTETMYQHIVRALSIMRSTSVCYPCAARIDYFGDLSLLVITLPGASHEILTSYSVFLHQTLYEQSFWWPAWGDDLERVVQTGSASVMLSYQGVVTELQPDAGLKVAGSNTPFLVIEVVDSEGHQHARMKARRFLQYSEGNIQFVIIIDLVRKTDKGRGSQQAMEERTRKGETDHSILAVASRHEHPRTLFNKRAAENYDSGPVSTKKARVDTKGMPPSAGGSSSAPSPTKQSNPRAVYTSGLVTVLTTELIPHPTLAGKTRRQLLTLVDAAEFWPTPPTAVFTFTWEDMNSVSYPAELAGRKFTLLFGELHRALQRFVETGLWNEEKAGKRSGVSRGWSEDSREVVSNEDLELREMEAHLALLEPVSGEE